MSQEVGKIELAVSESGNRLNTHTMEDVDLSLNLLAMNAENYSRTARELQDKYGMKITAPTLKKWACSSFPSKYLEVQQKLSGTIGERTTQKVSALALRGAETESKLLDRLDERINLEGEISVKDLAGAYNAISGATERNLKMKLLMEDKPTQITEVRTVEQAIKELEEDDIIVDAEIVSEETVEQQS